MLNLPDAYATQRHAAKFGLVFSNARADGDECGDSRVWPQVPGSASRLVPSSSTGDVPAVP